MAEDTAALNIIAHMAT